MSDLALIEDELKAREGEKDALISILQRAQEIYGYLPRDVIYHIASRLHITPAEIMGVATFYSQFRLEPIGKYVINACRGTACHINGSEKICEAISQYLGIEDGQTTEDGLFTVQQVACLGCCSLAPVMMINGEAHGNLTPDAAVKILREIREREAETCAL